MKTKDLFKVLILSFTIIVLTSCNNVSIEGSWIEPVSGLPSMQQGFVLEANGKASSINMATLQYETWKQENNQLILSGKSIGNHQTLSFTDTLKIENLTQDSLILKHGKQLLKYARKQKENIISVPTNVPISIKESFSVKGKLIISHEVRSFTAEGDSIVHWIIDKTGELIQKYDGITKGAKNGMPVYVELEVTDMGKSNDGFAADYASVYYVTKINKIKIK